MRQSCLFLSLQVYRLNSYILCSWLCQPAAAVNFICLHVGEITAEKEKLLNIQYKLSILFKKKNSEKCFIKTSTTQTNIFHSFPLTRHAQSKPWDLLKSSARSSLEQHNLRDVLLRLVELLLQVSGWSLAGDLDHGELFVVARHVARRPAHAAAAFHRWQFGFEMETVREGVQSKTREVFRKKIFFSHNSST